MPPNLSGTPLERLQCALGICVFIAAAWLIGRWRTRGHLQRSAFPWRTVIWGVALQFAFALLVLRLPYILIAINDAITALLGYTRDGAKMVFGNLAENKGAPLTDSNGNPTSGYAQTGAYFAFFVLPTIIFFSALTAIAYHVGILQLVVQGLAWIMSKSMKTSGAETLSAAANIFVGQTEAPLMVKPFVGDATRSELMCIMVAGFANIASGVLGVYTEWLQPYIDSAGGHLAAACLISAPASLLVSKLLVPETETATTAAGIRFKIERLDANLVDAAARGTSEGLTLALNVAAMLIAFTALVALINALIAWVGGLIHLAPGGRPPTLQSLLSYPLAPVAWLTGISWSECGQVGSLVGIKTVLNELFAYKDMQSAYAANPHFLSPRSGLITLYMLCGFANFASVGIQVGGISTLAPNRRADLSRLGLLAMFGGALASHMTAAVVGVLL
jgi:CNT family concentrative nucleoside transporter